MAQRFNTGRVYFFYLHRNTTRALSFETVKLDANLTFSALFQGWFVSAGLIYAGLNSLSSLAMAAWLTPTDPMAVEIVESSKDRLSSAFQ
ncbi:hypothetical protein JOM56_006969 [Amanita muscaria]